MKIFLLVAIVLAIPTYALAQAAEKHTPEQLTPIIVAPSENGEPEVTGSVGGFANGGPSAVEVIPGRTGASTIVNDSAAGGNAEQQTRSIPQFGGNGGNGSGGGG